MQRVQREASGERANQVIGDIPPLFERKFKSLKTGVELGNADTSSFSELQDKFKNSDKEHAEKLLAHFGTA